MRLILNILALVALLVAPLAAPAAAFAAAPVASECTTKTADGPGHVMPNGDHMAGKACCIAVPPAIDPPLAALEALPDIAHLAFVPVISSFRLGAGPKAEDPPPRAA